MNKSCEKKPTAHSQNILHVDVLYNIKRKKYKTVCAELAFAKSPSTEWSWFCIELVIVFLYLLCSWIIAMFKECLIKSRNSHCLYRYQVTLIVFGLFFCFQMNRNLVGSNYGRSSIKIAHFIPIPQTEYKYDLSRIS